MIALFSAFAFFLAVGAAPPAAPSDAAEPPAAPAAQRSGPQCQTGSTLAVEPGLGSAELVLAFCEASCDGGQPVSCSGASCSAVDRFCPYQQGYVVCDGNYTFCQPACPTEGCTLWQCRQGCSCPGGVSVCHDIDTCECGCIYQ